MNNTVYDTKLIATVNCPLSARRANTVLNRRIEIVEESVGQKQRTIARYNWKLWSEYEKHIKDYRNDIIILFFSKLADIGIRVSVCTLRRQHWNKIRNHWPSHDQHLIAAAIGGCQTSHCYNRKSPRKCCCIIIARI